jgi:hypothetical protein
LRILNDGQSPKTQKFCYTPLAEPVKNFLVFSDICHQLVNLKKPKQARGQISPEVNKVYNLDKSTPFVPQGLQRACDQ